MTVDIEVETRGRSRKTPAPALPWLPRKENPRRREGWKQVIRFRERSEPWDWKGRAVVLVSEL